MPEKLSINEKIVQYVFYTIITIVLGAVLIYGDPTKAQAWVPTVRELGVALPGLIAIFQLRSQAAKLEVVREDVNSKTTAALKVTGESEYARGQLEAIQSLEAVVRNAVATERAAAAAASVSKE